MSNSAICADRRARALIGLLKALGCSLAAVCVLAAPAGAVQITEFSLPAKAKPVYITAGPDGDMWFTDNGTNTIGRITTSGEAAEFGLGVTPEANLTGIAAGPDGNLWFTERNGRKIGRITPAGAITEFSAGLTNNPDIYGITAGPEKDMWFTETYTAHIGKIDPSTGQITELPASQSGGVFTKIAAGPEGNLWYTVSNQGLIGEMTAAGTSTSSSPLPPSDCTSGYPTSCPYPESITVGPEGDMWFDERHANAIGRITPTGLVSEFADGLTHEAGVADLAAGPEGDMWFTEAQANQVGRITPTGTIAEYTWPSREAGLFGIALGPDENLWVVENGAGKIARVIPDVPPQVSTSGASGVTSRSASVTGAVRSRGADTQYRFEYGPTPSYGLSTPSLDNGAGDSVQPVNATLSGLAPATTYHYRVVAANANGTSYGQDEAFTTAPAPPHVTVGEFAISFRVHIVHKRSLYIEDLFVFGLRRGEEVSYACERCDGSPKRAAKRASGERLAFKTHGLIVTARSTLRVRVSDLNGSKRERVYGIIVSDAETSFESQRCFLPASKAPVACPGSAKVNRAAKHEKQSAKHKPHGTTHEKHGTTHEKHSTKHKTRRAEHHKKHPTEHKGTGKIRSKDHVHRKPHKKGRRKKA